MAVEPGDPARYTLRAGDDRLPLDSLLGEPLRLAWSGAIACTNCGRATRKSFGQGHCYPCFKRLARCDTCIMKPELCHYFQGTCREPEWGESTAFSPHRLPGQCLRPQGRDYPRHPGADPLARPGAVQALPILEVDSRQQSGFVEMLFKGEVSDRTNWRAMLKGETPELDLAAERDRLFAQLASGLDALRERFGESTIRPVEAAPRTFTYPVLEYPTKVVSHNFDKRAEVAGR